MIRLMKPTQQQEAIEFIAAKGFDINTITGLKTALKWLKSADFQDLLSYNPDASFERADIAAGELRRNMLIHSVQMEILRLKN